MKYLGYIVRNCLRNPIRSALTIGSIAVSLALMTMLITYVLINKEARSTVREYNRVIALSSQGFAVPLTKAMVDEIAGMDGITASSPLQWFGGQYGEETLPFAQFGVYADKIFEIYGEYRVPPDQLQKFKDDRRGCIVGRKLFDERKLKLGDPLPIKGRAYPVTLQLVVRGVYDGPENRDLRACWFHWAYLDELLKPLDAGGVSRYSGKAGAAVAKCANAEMIPEVCRKIDSLSLNSENPSRTQSEEAFLKMFSDMAGDLTTLIRNVGAAVVVALLCVSGNAMAMSMRERTTEIAVLKAIGYPRRLVLLLVLAEAMLVAGVGGMIGAFGSKLLFDAVDISKFAAGFLPFFVVSWTTALIGLAVAVFIGFAGGLVPALQASRISVINGLRKVI